MNRFFIDSEDINEEDGTAVIRGEPVKHISRVLRMRIKDPLIIADGQGNSYLCEINEIGREQVLASIKEKLIKRKETFLDLVLCQALTKGEKMDFIIQKSTELGVKKIIPFTAERSVVRISVDKARDRVNRWQKIAKGAAEQSHRDRIPEVGAITSLESILMENQDTGPVLFLWEQEEKRGLKEVLKENPDIKKVLLLVGPEGGFTLQEAELALSQGAVSVSLGPRILRTETAAAAAVTMVLYELGDLGEADGK
ncbi:16S rRNA (uracil(1498)-N(3))-methyltransferase [Candidatus Contubernalis alkaliaceticus]|uniref:16S rRNA (uracil(1498)-N(3))-methyltransferase n=1 Tax=Candidatus Contubernalis alkaliaceticus TaxID=338645 RepID=UPI001F4C1184|nr:16S rRNA (uracil(1498)-N(3))-methyltransferase [Candidatus Contubernalis alkalaceticus]UNC93238.1 16S rRNA (uracil(1498)-N(3))-methyltransferase [Candidatus Contubernalis alkalaceticus]